MTQRVRRLVLISGAPGSGKTTLARVLSEQLGLPCFSRDDLKEVLLDTLGAANRTESQQIGRASFALLLAIVGRMVDMSTGVIVESNFRRGRSEPELRPLIERMPATLIHCQTSPDEIVRRYRERAQRGDRHPGHFDRDALSNLIADLDAGRYEPLDLAIPIVIVDTTVGYAPSLEEIGSTVSSSRLSDVNDER